MDTWGISGSAFLAIFAALFAATWVFVRWRRERIMSTTEVPGGVPTLGSYEAAMLCGGGKLVLAVAASRLKERGLVSLNSSGKRVVVTGELQPDDDEVEACVYASIKDASLPASKLLDQKRAQPVLAPIRARLRDLGLMPTEEQITRMRREVLWFAPVIVLGIARLVAGLHNHRPVGFLVVLLVAASFAALTRLAAPPRTGAGDRALKALRARPSDVDPVASTAALAVTGMAALWTADAAFAGALGLTQSSGGSGFSGGGCGGGGCGGGGCGG